MLLAVRKYIAKCTFPVSVPSPTVPPDIIEDNTSSDIVVKENQSIQLKCKATGYPTPIISWLREDAKPIKVHNKEQMTVEGSYLKIPHALRENSGAYLCLASNGVPPSVSRRIELLIQFPPKINVPSEVIGAALHSDVVLICMVEAAPLPLTSWHHKDKTLIFSNNKVSISVIEDSYKYQMNVKIFNLSKEDYGIYACTARNILGDAEGTIKLFEEGKSVTGHLASLFAIPTLLLPCINDATANDRNRVEKANCLRELLIMRGSFCSAKAYIKFVGVYRPSDNFKAHSGSSSIFLLDF
ncbi:Lachesin [Nymphon striatum]|nr:Lachesin [Nymphon striatum]